MDIEERYLKDYMEYLGLIKKYSEHTLRAYRQDIEQYIDYFKENKQTVTKENIRSYIGVIFMRTKNKATIARKIYAMKSFYRYLVKQGKVEKNLFDAVSVPKNDKKLPEILTEKEMNAFLDQLPESTFPEIRNKAAFEFLYATGLRVSELVGLKMEDLNIPEGLARVLGKGNKERIVPFHPRAAELIQRYLSQARATFKKSNDFVFLSNTGKPMSIRMVDGILPKVYYEVTGSSKHVHPHLFRHSFATHMLQRGANLRVIQELLGHASLSTTEKYTNLNYGDLLNVYKKFHPRG